MQFLRIYFLIYMQLLHILIAYCAKFACDTIKCRTQMLYVSCLEAHKDYFANSTDFAQSMIFCSYFSAFWMSVAN